MNLSAFRNFDKVAAITAGVWLIFLTYPLQILWSDSTHSTFQAYSGTASIVVFSTIYIVSFGANKLLAIEPKVLRTLAWSGILLIPAFFLGLVLGPWVLFLETYFVSLWAFTAPPIGLKVGSAITLTAAFIMFYCYRLVWDNGGYGFIIGAGFVLLFAQLTHSSETKRAKDTELAQAKQAEQIARDVHDILGHSLTVLSLKAELATALIDSAPEKAKDELTQISELSRTALAEVRATVTRMKRPSFAGELEAGRRALETARIQAHLPDAEQATVAGNNATLFSWVLREAMTNVVRHSRAKNCWVAFDAERIEIVDDGGATELRPGNGLAGLGQRVQEAGGDLLLNTGDFTRLLVSMNGNTAPLVNPAEDI